MRSSNPKPLRPLSFLLMAGLACWALSGGWDRLSRSASPLAPLGFATPPSSPESSTLITLAPLCVGERPQATLGGRQRYVLLSQWLPESCASMAGRYGDYVRVLTLPSGARLQARSSYPSFSLNMGAGGVSQTFYYKPGASEPEIAIGSATGEGSYARPGNQARCNEIDPKPTCQALFRHEDPMDDYPERWSVFYTLGRDLAQEWETISGRH